MLEVKNISFGYMRNLTNIKDISLKIDKNEFIALCGRNGSGKTTLSRLLMGMEKPDKGKIILDGIDITSFSITKRSSKIGYVFQQPERQMFKNTVHEEIAFGLEQKIHDKREINDKVLSIMEKLNINQFSNEYPLSLSKGIKQKVAIASALITEPEILILDEPTSGQDAVETKELLKLLAEVHKEGITIILITHNMDIVAEYCSRIIALTDGIIGYDGSPKDLFKNRDIVTRLGLCIPTVIELANKVLGKDFCKSIENFNNEYLAKIRG